MPMVAKCKSKVLQNAPLIKRLLDLKNIFFNFLGSDRFTQVLLYLFDL